jgi:hypothetical protein
MAIICLFVGFIALTAYLAVDVIETACYVGNDVTIRIDRFRLREKARQ